MIPTVPCTFGPKCVICASPATEFRKAVFHVVAQIPVGKVMTYGAVASAIGRPQSQRAVGNALKANPFNHENVTCHPQVPCHRVVGKSHLGGFFGTKNIPTKVRLLRDEGVCDDAGVVAPQCIMDELAQMK